MTPTTNAVNADPGFKMTSAPDPAAGFCRSPRSDRQREASVGHENDNVYAHLMKSSDYQAHYHDDDGNRHLDDTVDSATDLNSLHAHVPTATHGNTTFNNFLSNLNIGSTIGRRFCSTYSKNLDVQKRPRLIKKSGELNIMMHNVPKHKRRLLSDFFNTVLDIKWRWHIVIFLLSFFISWLVFASVWYMIAFFHGDLKSAGVFPNDHYAARDDITDMLEHGHLPELNDLNEDDIDALRHGNILPNHVVDKLMDNIKRQKRNETIEKIYHIFGKTHKTEKARKKRMPCVFGVHDFTSALLYSVETQHTIGYGLRHITEECSFAIIFLMVQSCFGIFVQGLVAGVVFAKISRPVKRKRTIIFSHNAVVSKRDGKLCFMFKLANIRTTQLSDARIKMLMIKSRRTSEGEFVPFQSYAMKVGYAALENDSVFFPCPKTVEHVIDEESPLYELCKDAINSDKEGTKSETQVLNELNKKLTKNYYSEADKTAGDTASTAPTNETAGYDDKNEDFEIVVILEGNIETTGASCHIRTSYLPQEILFGYRFMPIYPKFTDFEYLFDYSKFDQVEPCQFELMHLNKAHFRPQMNHIYDATRENKNLQLTYQNTIKKQSTAGKYVKTEPSLASIVAAFKAQASKYTDENENQNKNLEKAQENGKLNGVSSHGNACSDMTRPSSDQVDGNCPHDSVQYHGNTKSNFNNSISNDSNQQTITTSNNTHHHPNACYNSKLFGNLRSGRFTIVPVGCSKADDKKPTTDLCELEANNSDGSEAKLKSLNEETNSSLNMVSSTNFSESLSSSFMSDDLNKSPKKSSDLALIENETKVIEAETAHLAKLQQLPKHVLFRLNDHNTSYYHPRSNEESECTKSSRYRPRTNSLPVQFQFKNKQSRSQT